MRKRTFPVENARRFLEPGPIVLVSSAWKNETDIMTMGWHAVMEFSPSLIGCCISSANHSHQLIRKSRECVINLPTLDLIDAVVGIGNTTGAEIDKFAAFGLTPAKAREVRAPLIRECHANFECRLYDTGFVRKYSFFVFEIVRAHVAPRPKTPTTIHYRGDGEFMVSGKILNKRRLFRPEML